MIFLGVFRVREIHKFSGVFEVLGILGVLGFLLRRFLMFVVVRFSRSLFLPTVADFHFSRPSGYLVFTEGVEA